MFKVEILGLIIEFIVTKCIIEFNYSLFVNELPNIITSFLAQIFFGIYLTAHSLRLVLEYNIILHSFDGGCRSFLIAIVAQLAPSWEILKLVHAPEGLFEDYLSIVYTVIILTLSIINIAYPNSFKKLKKFNFGFTIQYLILALLNIQVDVIIPCVILGIVSIYLTPIVIDKTTIKPKNIISFIFISQEFILVLVYYICNDQEAILAGFLLVKAITAVIYMVAVILEFRKLNSSSFGYNGMVGSGNDVEEGRVINSQDNNTNNSDYSTFI